MSKRSLAQIAADLYRQGKGEFRKEIVEYEGQKWLVKQPDERTLQMIYSMARQEDPTQPIDRAKLMIWSLMYCVLDPETEQRVFTPEVFGVKTEADLYEAISSAPSWMYRPLKLAVTGIVNSRRDDQVKNSSSTGATTTATS